MRVHGDPSREFRDCARYDSVEISGIRFFPVHSGNGQRVSKDLCLSEVRDLLPGIVMNSRGCLELLTHLPGHFLQAIVNRGERCKGLFPSGIAMGFGRLLNSVCKGCNTYSHVKSYSSC